MMQTLDIVDFAAFRSHRISIKMDWLDDVSKHMWPDRSSCVRVAPAAANDTGTAAVIYTFD